MRIRRRLPILLGVLLVIAAVGLAVYLRKHAPPEPARLLPDAEGFLYMNLQWVRRAQIAGPIPSVSHDPEYQRFIEGTGFEFERDMDEAALAIHYPYPSGAEGSSSAANHSGEVRFSEVFVGKVDGERLRNYLHKISATVEEYRSLQIYSIPLQGRTVRVAVLGVDTVAASNHDDPDVIRGIVDRSRRQASPFGGPDLLREYFKHVPLASLVWGIFRVDAPGSQAAKSGSAAPSLGPMPLGLSLLFQKPAVIVASGRYLGAVHLRAEAFAGNEDEAKDVVEKVGTFLDIFNTAESAAGHGPSDPDVKQFFASIKTEQHKDRAVLTATVPSGFIKKAFAQSAGDEAFSEVPGPAPAAHPPAKAKTAGK